MQITFTPGKDYNEAPTGLTSALSYIAKLYDLIFTQPVKIDITVNWEKINPNFAASNTEGYFTYTYDTVSSGLEKDANDSTQSSAYATLPKNDPTGDNTFAVTEALAAALNLSGSSDDTTANLNIGASLTWSFVPGLAPTTGTTYLIGTAEHEISEMMGRISDNGTNVVNNNKDKVPGYTILDLFRYSSSHQRDLTYAAVGATSNTTAYFSTDNGVTNDGGGLWNNVKNGFDFADWEGQAGDPIPNDAFGTAFTAVVLPISAEDFTIMNVLGWDLNPNVLYPGQQLPGEAFNITYKNMTVINGGFFNPNGGDVVEDITYNGGTGLIDYGTIDSDGIVSAGGQLYLLPGGTGSDTIIASVGYEGIYGGVAIKNVIGSAGTQIVFSASEGLDFRLGGSLYPLLSAAGTTLATTLSGGEQIVYSGATASGTRVLGDDSLLIVEPNGLALNTFISGGGSESVSGNDAYAQITKGGIQTIGGAGLATAISATVSSGGLQWVNASGTADDTVLGFHGSQIVDDLAGAFDTVVSSGGSELIQLGGEANGITISSGGSESVHGLDSSATIDHGGVQAVVFAGQALGAHIDGGRQYVSWGGAADNTVVAAGSQIVSSAGVASDTLVSSGGVQVVYSAGTADNTQIAAGGQLQVSGGYTSQATVSGAGAKVIVHAGGTASATQVTGGELIVSSGGQAANATLRDGGTDLITVGGVASATTVSSGSVDFLGLSSGASGGTTIAANVDAGGTQWAYHGGEAYYTTVSGFGAVQNVSDEAYASFTLAESGGAQDVTGGLVDSTTIAAGAYQNIGSDSLSEIGIASNTVLIGTFGIVGAATQNVNAGGLAYYTILGNDGFQSVGSGGGVFATTINSGGDQYIFSGANALATKVGPGGIANVDGNDGLATISSGGVMSTYGTDAGATIESGGSELVFSGGIAGYATIETGGTLQVEPGGTASGTTTIAGGLLLDDNADVTGTVQFTDNGTLEVLGQVMPAATIDGFAPGDQIDLASIAPQGGGTATLASGNVLDIIEGATSVTLQLNPSQNFGGDQFSAGSDGNSGTLITEIGGLIGSGDIISVVSGQSSDGITVPDGAETEVLNGAVMFDARLDGGVQQISLGGVAENSLLTNGGREIIQAGGSSTDAVVDAAGDQLVGSSGVAFSATVNSVGIQTLFAFGVAYDTLINFGGFQSIAGGATSYDATIAGGTQLASGTAVDTTVSSGGTLLVAGAANDTTVLSGGTLIVETFGIVTDTTVSAGGSEIIDSFGEDSADCFLYGEQLLSGNQAIADGVFIESGGGQVIVQGGLANSASVLSGGTQFLSVGGGADYTAVSGGGQDIFAGGAAQWTSLTYGAVQNVSSGGIAYATDVENGGEEIVYSGGSAVGTVVSSGGTAVIASGGAFFSSAVISGGLLDLNAGAVASGPVDFTAPGGTLQIDGTAMPTMTISGFAMSDTIDLTGLTFDDTVTTNLLPVGFGNVLEIFEDGSAYDLQMDPTQNFANDIFTASQDAGTGVDVTVTPRTVALNIVGSGQIITVTADPGGLTVLSSGTVDVLSGGTVFDTQLDYGGVQNVFGSAVATTIADGGTENVEAAGVSLSASVDYLGSQNVLSGGTSLYAEVLSGTLTISSGGFAASGTLGLDSLLTVSSGGSVLDMQLNGATENLYGVASSTTVSNAATDNDFGTDLDAIVGDGGGLSVEAGGVAIGTVLLSGGDQTVFSGATASLTNLTSVGYELVASGGLDVSATVGNGAALYVEGNAEATALAAGGTLTIETGTVTEYAGAMLQGSVVNNGTLIFDANATLPASTSTSVPLAATLNGSLSGTGNVLVNGGDVVLGGGDMFGGTLTIGDGTLELTSAAAGGSAPITFATSGGVLQIDGTVMPTNTIDGFVTGDVIDLAGVSFDPSGGATLEAGNVLQVTADGTDYDLQLDPGADYTGSTFSLFSEAESGTYVFVGAAPVTGSSTVSPGQLVSDLDLIGGGLLEVMSGGSTSNTVVYNRAILIIDSGGTDLDATVNDGGNEIIMSGGIASGTVLNDPGTQTVSAGGLAIGATLNGGDQDVFGLASDTTIDSGGVQAIESGGIASVTTVNSSGVQLIGAGGVAIDTTVEYGGVDYVNFGGTAGGADNVSNGGFAASALGTVVSEGGSELVSAGGYTSGTLVNYAAEQDVFGTVVSTTVAGYLIIEDGGTASGAVVNPGGQENVLSGGADDFSTIGSGGYADIFGGASGAMLAASGNLTVWTGGTLTEYDGAALQGTLANDGLVTFDLTTSGATFAGSLNGYGALIVEGGGTLTMGGGDNYDGLAMIAGGTLELTSATAVGSGPLGFAAGPVGMPELEIDGTTMPSNTISGFAAGDLIDLAGVGYDTNGSVMLGANNVLEVTVSGAAHDLQLDPTADYSTTTFTLASDGQGGTLVLIGGAAVTGSASAGAGQDITDEQILNDGSVTVSAGGTANDLTIDSGGIEYVSSGATDIGTTVDDGGTQYVLSSGFASDTILNDPGIQVIAAGGLVIGAQILGGEEDVFGTASAAVVSAGGTQVVESGGLATATNVANGGSTIVSSGGVASMATIGSGGEAQIHGLDISATISGYEQVESGGTASAAAVFSDQDVVGGVATATLVESGGVQNVYAIALATTVSGGATLNALFGGTAGGAILLNGGVASITFEGAAVGTLIDSGGQQIVDDGGSASSTVVSRGGIETVSAGGTTIGTTVDSGGVEMLTLLATASAAAIVGGTETIGAGAEDFGATIGSGGAVSVSDGGVASSTIIDSGGVESVSTEGDIAGTVTINGGTLILAAGADGGDVAFENRGTLQILDSSIPQSLVIGGFMLGDTIDLASIAFDSAGSATPSGTTLDVVESGQSYDLQFAAAVMGAFVLSSDGGIGTDIALQPAIVSSGETLIVSALQTSAGLDILSAGAVIVSGTVDDTTVGTGALLKVQSGGLADPTMIASGGSEVVSSGGTDLGALIAGVQMIALGGSGSGGTVESGGVEITYGVAIAINVSSDGLQFVLSGGSASGSVVSSAGEGYIGTSGTSLSAQVQGGGAEVLFGTDSGASLSGTSAATGTQYDFGIALGGTTLRNGFQEVALAGAVASGMTVEYGGEQYVGSGGTALSTQVESGGAEVVFGFDSGASLSGTQYDFGTASGGTTYNNGFQEVAPGATAIGMTVESGGQQYIGVGGSSLNAQIAGGGAEVVFGGDSGTNLSGTQYLYGTASGGTTINSGTQLVASGATACGMTVSSGGQQYVGAGGTAIATIVAPQGAQVVFGAALGALVSGTQYDFAYASGGTTYNSGTELVAPSATATGMTVEAGGQQYVGAGGTALATTIATGGVEQVFGSDSGALVSGTQYDFSIASGGTIFNSGYQLVAPAGAGTALGMTVLAGGQQYVVGGGTASGTQLMSQGVEIVHGTDLGATVSGTQYVYGLASGTVLATGGYQLVSAGGSISAVSISGGTVELQSGALEGAAPISFTGPGELILDASTSFSGTVASFDSGLTNDSIDFADIPYVAAGSAGATTVNWSPGSGSGTLSVSEGGHTANITLIGQYTGTFNATAAGGGTLITYSPATGDAENNPEVVVTVRHV